MAKFITKIAEQVSIFLVAYITKRIFEFIQSH